MIETLSPIYRGENVSLVFCDFLKVIEVASDKASTHIKSIPKLSPFKIVPIYISPSNVEGVHF